MFIYIDESVFYHEGQEYYSVGLLAVEKEIDGSIIAEALANLIIDPDINDEATKKMDYRTLEKGIFHAADDSKNAHSHLCTAISGSINGIIRYAIIKPHEKTTILSVEEKHRINTQMVNIIATEFNEPTQIYIEQRSELSQGSAENLLEKFLTGIDASTYSHPFLSALYPKIEVHVVAKDNHGIQVVDFMIWALNNKYSLNKKSNWIDRLGLRFSFSYDQCEGDMAGGEYVIGKSISNKISWLTSSPYPNSVLPLGDNYYKRIPFVEIYRLAEQTLHSIARSKLNGAEHFRSSLTNLIERLYHEPTTEALIYDSAKIFIRLFDTLPIYRELDKAKNIKEFELLLHIRRCMGLIINGEIYGTPAIQVFKKIREEIVMKDKDSLFAEPIYQR